MAARYDLIIRDGLVVDGTGGAPFEADVAIRGDRIAAVGRHIHGQGRWEIDARHRLVTPGFTDVHTHYDGQISWEKQFQPSSSHGVTTVVMGNCGVGFAPVKADQRDLLISLMEGVEDIPEVVMTAGIPWAWESFPDYLNFLGRRASDIDFAAQLPHSALRVFVMGERALDAAPATPDDLARMRDLAREALAAGAIGVSTSRSYNHRFPDGRPAPSVISQEAELFALAQGLRDAGRGVFQLQTNRAEPARAEFALMRRISEVSGRPLSFTLIPDQKGDWQDYLAGIQEAMAEGQAIRGQFLPRPPGVMLGLDLSFHYFSFMPSYLAIADLSLAQRVAAMRDPGFRARLLAEEPAGGQPHVIKFTQATHPLFVLGDPPNYLPDITTSLEHQARVRGVPVRELIYDALLEDDGHQILYHPTGNYLGDDFAFAGKVLGDPGIVLGLGDGGAHYGIVCDGAFPTFFLKEWVLNDKRPNRLSLERAIAMLTQETSRLVGLNDRGVLVPGYKADVNVIDPDRLHLHAPRMVANLPADGRRLLQKAQGYDATIVSGVKILAHDVATGALPGRLIRGAQPEPAPLAQAG